MQCCLPLLKTKAQHRLGQILDSQRCSMTENDDILFEKIRHAGVITLNKPETLNAVTDAMLTALNKQLDDWEQDPGVLRVIVRAVPGKAFSAGGDIRHLYERGKAGDFDFDFFAREYALNAMHQDQVVQRPQEAEVICSSEFCENAGFAYKGKAISFQPHPEFDDHFMDELLALRAGKSMSHERAAAARESLGNGTDSPQIAAEIAKFFRETVKTPA